jgi:hypothetical protein
MYRLGYSRVDRVIVVDIDLFECFHLQRIHIHVKWQQIKGKISDVYVIIELIFFKELFAYNGSFRPKTRIVFFVSFIFVQLNEILQDNKVFA